MSKILYLSDEANWVIDEIGSSLEKELSTRGFSRTKRGLFNLGGINHYTTRYAVYSKAIWSPFARKVLTYFHGEDSDVALLAQLQKVQTRFDFIHTSCQITRDHLIKHGIQPEKIQTIPIGIDVKDFSLVDEEKRRLARQRLNLPSEAFVIGSFQKDGVGWGDGMEAKLIKGPDVFCDAIEHINKQRPVHVLLTGPARGYVKKRLQDAGVPFQHVYLEKYSDVPACFHALDAYIVASRLEGGPRAPMECFASGIPVVATRVGQVPEQIIDGENGFMVEVEDVAAIVSKTIQLIDSPALRTNFALNGLKGLDRWDYKNIAQDYWRKLYQPLL